MANRVFVATVVLLWVITMYWLVATKILPPLDDGQPPTYKGIQADEISCWHIRWGERPIGWAARKVTQSESGTREVHGRIRLNRIDLKTLAPSFLGSWAESLGPIRIDVISRIDLDPLGDLAGLSARLRINDAPMMTIAGRVRGAVLDMSITVGASKTSAELPITNYAGLGSEISPSGRMNGMYVGRRWKMHIFSPFAVGGFESVPQEVIEATVTGEEHIECAGRMQLAKRIEFRRLGEAGVSKQNSIRAILWVAGDGMVIRQKVFVLGGELTFDRRVDAMSLERADRMIEEGQRLTGTRVRAEVELAR